MTTKTAATIARLRALAASSTFAGERAMIEARIERMLAQTPVQTRAYTAYDWAMSMRSDATTTATFTPWGATL